MLQRAQIDSLLPRGGGDYDVFVAGAGPAGFGAALVVGALGLESTSPYGQVADFGMGLAFGMLMVGVLLTSRRAAAIRAAKIRLLQKAGLRCGDEETSS